MSDELTVERARQILDSYLRRHYNIGIDDVELTNTPGYWRSKKPCGGRGKCKLPIHSYIGNDGPICHTYSFAEYNKRDSKGRFVRPYRVWEILKKEES